MVDGLSPENQDKLCLIEDRCGEFVRLHSPGEEVSVDRVLTSYDTVAVRLDEPVSTSTLPQVRSFKGVGHDGYRSTSMLAGRACG